MKVERELLAISGNNEINMTLYDYFSTIFSTVKISTEKYSCPLGKESIDCPCITSTYKPKILFTNIISNPNKESTTATIN